MRVRILLLLLLSVVLLFAFNLFHAEIFKYFISDVREAELTGRATPATYGSLVVKDDELLRYIAKDYSPLCKSEDRACILYNIYMRVTTEYAYIEDPKGQNTIAGANITYDKKGGDCEDLSILLASLLENRGIKTKLAIQENHVYVLACGIPPKDMWSYMRRLERFRGVQFGLKDISVVDADGEECLPADPSDKGNFPYPGAPNNEKILHIVGY